MNEESKTGDETEAGDSAVAETEYLMSIPGMTESIEEGLAEPVSECAGEGDLEW